MDKTSIDKALVDFKRSSRTFLILIGVGMLFIVVSTVYSVVRLRPLDDQVNDLTNKVEAKKKEISNLQVQIYEKEKEFGMLKANIEKLSYVRVTPKNAVYELKATARATGVIYDDNRPEYNFKLYVNAPKDVIGAIRGVTYTFDHPTFRQKRYVSTSPGNLFEIMYTGWGCLTSVGVEVQFLSGETTAVDFNMCKSLGQQWGQPRGD